jgi:hypothetical protein
MFSSILTSEKEFSKLIGVLVLPIYRSIFGKFKAAKVYGFCIAGIIKKNDYFFF